MELKKYKLEECCLHITDGEHGSVNDDLQGDYYLLSNKNIINGNIVISKDDRKINKATFDKINKRILLEEKDVIISTVGTLGKTAIIEGNINVEDHIIENGQSFIVTSNCKSLSLNGNAKIVVTYSKI